MNTQMITVAGPIESALTHFAGLGLASILEAAGAEPVMLGWTDEADPRLQLEVPCGEQEIKSVLSEHVGALDSPDSWIHAQIVHEGREGTGLFSPRLKEPKSRESWQNLDEERLKVIDGLLSRGDLLSLDMIGGLGRPAYWRFDRTGKEGRPDQGASRWEMKARNRGDEFLGNRFSPMLKAMSARSGEEILAGLTGGLCRDDLDSKSGSQSATGLQRPGPVDTALAWCGLWGIASFPVTHSGQQPSRTPGAFPQGRDWPTSMCLPVTLRKVTLARMRNLLESEALSVVGGAASDGVAEIAARDWLAELGAVALIHFPIERRGSDSAPQRIVLDGEVDVLQGRKI